MKRRQFIKTSAVTTLGFPLVKFSKNKSSSLGVALVGLGYYSRDLLAPALQLTEHCHLAGLVTGSPDKIPDWQRKYTIPTANIYNYENMAEMANNPAIDVIYIVVPTGLHAKYAIKAAATGKHVWCEKPMAKTVKECEAIIAACAEHKVKLSIGYRMQHEPNTQTVMQWAQTKPYGKIESLAIASAYAGGAPAPGNWRLNAALGGGALYDMGVYAINAARYASGDYPIAVRATDETKRKAVFQEVDETTVFDLEFKNGLIAKCRTSVGENVNYLKVGCENGSYELSPMQAYNGVVGSASDGTLLNTPIQNQQARQMDNDALAITQNKKMMVPGQEGLLDIRIVEATKEAVRTGERVMI